METVVEKKPKRKVERNRATRVQKHRLWAQVFSFALNIVIGVQFYLYVEYLRRGGEGWRWTRPEGVEGWLPIGSLVSLRYWWETGIINNIHPAGLVIFVAILLTAFLFKKGFCSWVCPVGFISEILGDLSDKVFGRRLRPPRWLDYPLRSLKYIILAFFLWAVLWSMTSPQIEAFIFSDYNIVADILMLRFFTDASVLTVSVVGGLILLSLVIRGFWCRYLCPYGALLGLIGLVSPTRIKRNPISCIDCGACARACPSFIEVDKVKSVMSDECTGCMACVDSCPVKDTLEIKTPGTRKALPTVKWAAVLLIVFWGTLFTAKLWGPWENGVTDEQYIERIDKAYHGAYAHP